MPWVFDAVTLTVSVDDEPPPEGTNELGLKAQVSPVGIGLPQLRKTVEANPLSPVRLRKNVVEPVPLPAMVCDGGETSKLKSRTSTVKVMERVWPEFDPFTWTV